MVLVVTYIDCVLVPMSIFLMVGYHAYLWHCFKRKPSQTTIGIDALGLNAWFQDIKEANDKKSTLVIQTLRNTQMATIFTATITILINTALAALMNNAYNASHLLHEPIFGLQSGRTVALKFGAASLFLLISFLFTSMGLGFMVDSNFLINVSGEFSSISAFEYTQDYILQRGFLLALIGNRVLCMSLPLVLWMLGPIAVTISSVLLVCVLYGLDFAS